MTRKEQKEERRKEILFTALNLFVTKGYYDTKITDIAEAASMSTGLLFHYFESKEALLVALVTLGSEKTQIIPDKEVADPDAFLKQCLVSLFDFAKKQPFVFQMFLLMGQARRAGMPEEVRKIVLSVDLISKSSKLIEDGQKKGLFRQGDAFTLSTCFWNSVQGIMEEMAFHENLKAPDPDWLMAILRKN